MPMGTYTKIKVIMLYTLNNAEYLAYMNSVLALLPPPSGGEEDRPDELLRNLREPEPEPARKPQAESASDRGDENA